VNDDALFDQHALDYDATVQRAIGASGESVQYFAELKARLMARRLGGIRPATILDFGCGIGNTTRALAAQFPASTVTGFDISLESIEVARRTTRAGNVRFTSAADHRLPFDDAAFDAAFTSCVFHHIEPRERLRSARELGRVLVPGAPLFLFEHNPLNPLTVLVVRSIPFDEGVVLLKSGDAIRLLRAAGFSTSTPWFYFFFPAMLRALRPLEPWLRRVPIGAQYFVVGRSAAQRRETRAGPRSAI
jgi:ubiquinone/menaquinone biosynthesis C-methylase UbiE